MAQRKVSGATITVVAVGAVAVILLLWFVTARNRLVTMDERVESAWSEIDNQLQRRADLVPNLVRTVQGFAAQEREVIGQVTEARARLAGANTVPEKAEGNAMLDSALARLLVVVENYPNLKSNENFIRLQDELAGTENRIAVARRRYNDTVRGYNTALRVWPTSTVARRAGLEQREYFEVSDAAREVPQVQF